MKTQIRTLHQFFSSFAIALLGNDEIIVVGTLVLFLLLPHVEAGRHRALEAVEAQVSVGVHCYGSLCLVFTD